MGPPKTLTKRGYLKVSSLFWLKRIPFPLFFLSIFIEKVFGTCVNLIECGNIFGTHEYGSWFFKRKFVFMRTQKIVFLCDLCLPRIQFLFSGEIRSLLEVRPLHSSHVTHLSPWQTRLPMVISSFAFWSHVYINCHDPNSERSKIWPMILGQRFDHKSSS